MRKGFSRRPQEKDDGHRGEPGRERPVVKNYITPDGLQRLRDEHRFLLMRERPAVTQVVAWAASNGDRSENADYQYGKRRLRQIDRRIRFLTKRIDADEWSPSSAWTKSTSIATGSVGCHHSRVR